MSTTDVPAANTENLGIFEDKNLTLQDHLDPDKHFIGDSLPAPSSGEVATSIGVSSGTGSSPFPARADHTHKLDPTFFPFTLYFAPSGITDATTGSSFVTWFILPTFTVPSWATSAVIQININNMYGITAACDYAFDAIISTSSGGYADYGYAGFPRTSERVNTSFTRERTGFTTGPQGVHIGARRWNGTGGARADAATRVTGYVIFTQ
jgi:hypothetical protein